MTKYEKIIKNLYRIDKESFEAFEKKLECIPQSEEWKAYEAIENNLDELVKQELASLDKCITWYRQRAKTADDIELVVDLEAAYKELHEHMVCDLTDDEIDSMVTGAAKGILESVGIDISLLDNEEQSTGDMAQETTTMTKQEALEVLQQMFNPQGCREDIVKDMNAVITKEAVLNTTCEHYISEELDRLGYEIPFQKNWMQNTMEYQKAAKQKEALELVAALSKENETKQQASPSEATLHTANVRLALSQLTRADVKPHEIDRIRQNLLDERYELECVGILIGENSKQYQAILNEIAEWQKLLDAAVDQQQTRAG